MKYDPLKPPNPKEWLAKKESERISMVEKYHRVAQIKLPAARIHAELHVVIETQLANKYASTVNAMQRLLADGLDRHDAIHAMCTVLMNVDWQNFDAEKFDSDMNRVNAATWRAAFEMDEDDEDDEDDDDDDGDDDLEYEDDFEDEFDDEDDEYDDDDEDEDELEDDRAARQDHLDMLKKILNDPDPTLDGVRPVIQAQIEKYESAKLDTPFNRLLQEGFDFPDARGLTDAQLSAKLPELFTRMAAQGIYLCNTDHLSDRELYNFLREDALREEVPEFTGKPEENWVIDTLDLFDPKDEKLYYKYYADDEDRAEYLKDYPGKRLPPKEKPPYDRDKSLPDFDFDLDSIGGADIS